MHVTHEAVVKLLLERGADVDMKGPYGWTSLYWLFRGGTTWS